MTKALYVVLRVDRSPSWFAGYKDGKTTVTENYYDAAMVPLDPRLEKAYAMGAEELLSCVAVEKLFPMHLWEKFDTIARYRAEYPQHADIVVPITRNGEAFPL